MNKGYLLLLCVCFHYGASRWLRGSHKSIDMVSMRPSETTHRRRHKHNGLLTRDIMETSWSKTQVSQTI